MSADDEPSVPPLVTYADIGFIADDLGVGKRPLKFLNEVEGKDCGQILIVQNSLVRDGDAVDIAENMAGHSRTDAVGYAVRENKAQGMKRMVDGIERTTGLGGLNGSYLSLKGEQ